MTRRFEFFQSHSIFSCLLTTCELDLRIICLRKKHPFVENARKEMYISVLMQSKYWWGYNECLSAWNREGPDQPPYPTSTRKGFENAPFSNLFQIKKKYNNNNLTQDICVQLWLCFPVCTHKTHPGLGSSTDIQPHLFFPSPFSENNSWNTAVSQLLYFYLKWDK